MTAPLVTIHAAALDASMWAPLAARLPGAVLGYDQTAPDRVAELASFLDARGIGRAALCGCGIGAAIALAFAAKQPERVEAHILISLSLPQVSESPQRRALRPPLDAPREALVDGLTRLAFDGPARPPQPGRGAARALFARNLGRAEAPRATEWADDDEIAELRAPTLVILARHDFDDAHEAARRIAALVAGAQLREIEAGPLAPLEMPEEVAALIADFYFRAHENRDALP